MNDWWLKVERAKKHMLDINKEAMRYTESHPYSFTHIRLPDSKQEIRGRFHITKQPDPMIAIMLGDFIHNLRSALDWVVVACSPKKLRYKASFPIIFDDIFAKDRNGNFVVNNTHLRNSFNTAIAGLCPEARTFIINLQPYRATELGLSPDIHNLGIVSRLENADKHRQLITVGCGGQDFTVSLTISGFTEPFKLRKTLATGGKFLKDNTVIPYSFSPDGLFYPDGTPINPSEVDMHLSGTVKIFVQIASRKENQPPDIFPLENIMNTAVLDVTEILKWLEFFVVTK